MVKMASGIVGGLHMAMTGAAAAIKMSHNMAAILHLIEHVTLLYTIHLWYWPSILWSIDTYQRKVAADQYHITILEAQVLGMYQAF